MLRGLGFRVYLLFSCFGVCLKARMRGWENPSRQHDVAEYVLFLCRCDFLAHANLQFVWQARGLDGSMLRHLDGGQSVPLLLPPPGEVSRELHCETSIQRLLDMWQQQEEMHAAVVPSPACRFDYETGRSFAVKRRYYVTVDEYVAVPCFTDGLQTRGVIYKLSSVIVHLKVPWARGFYRRLRGTKDSGTSVFGVRQGFLYGISVWVGFGV